MAVSILKMAKRLQHRATVGNARRQKIIANSPLEYRTETLRRKSLWMRLEREQRSLKHLERDRLRRQRPEERKKKNAILKRWTQRHPFRIVAHRIKSYGGNVTPQQLAALYHKQRGKCALSGRKLTRGNMTIDHIMPLSQNGSHELFNLRWTCRAANEAKGRQTDTEFFQLCREVLAFNKDQI